MSEPWTWLAFAGLGAFHGLNPAMGWLFAVALGLHRQSRTVVMVSLLPIALGHLASIAAVAGLLVLSGYFIPHHLVQIGAGTILLLWAAYHWRFGHRHRVRFGMQVGLVGLAAWSFLMATAHGAGLMLWPVLMPLCAAQPALEGGAAAPVIAMLAGVGLHTVAMIATIAVVAAMIYEWIGLAVLRSTWVNVDMLWVFALATTGAVLVLLAVS